MTFTITTKQIKTKDFLNTKVYEENPVQRNHEKRLNAPHLKGKVAAPQCIVNVALLGSRKIVLDGHSRRAAWANGQLSCPETLLCVCYKISTIDDAIQLYKYFDSRLAVEKPSDLFETARKESGINLESAMLNNSLKTTLEIADYLYTGSRSKGTLELINMFKESLEFIDSFGFVLNTKNLRKVFCAGTRAAMIVSIHNAIKQGVEEDVASFWEDLYSYSEVDSTGITKNAYRVALQSDRGTGAITELGKQMLSFVDQYIKG